jgi:beta propeller repeat protein
MYDLSKDTERLIASGIGQQWGPKIYGDKIVWWDSQYRDSDIYMYDISKNTKTQITSAPGYQNYPEIYEDKIVWRDSRNGNSDIYMYNLSTSTETRIPSDSPMTTYSLASSLPPNNNGWYRSDVSISLSATDNLSGVAKTEYRINEGNWTIYTGPFALSTEGTNTIEYQSTDRDGNIEQTKSLQVKIDKTTPITTHTLTSSLPSSNGWYKSDGIHCTLSYG